MADKAGKKRPRVEEAEPVVGSSSSSSSSNQINGGGGGGGAYNTTAASSTASTAMSAGSSGAALKKRMIRLLEKNPKGLMQKDIEKELAVTVTQLLPVLQELLNEKRLQPFTVAINKDAPGGSSSGRSEMLYRIISAENAARLSELSAEDQLVLQAVEKSANSGIWVRTLKLQTRLQQTQINKIIKRLENCKLIKPVKSIVHKARRMYMLYDLEPAKHLTGGPWYSEQELDLEFIEGVRNTVCRILETRNGVPMTAGEVARALRTSGVCTIPLSAYDVSCILNTLVSDGYCDTQDGGSRRLGMFPTASRALFPHSGASIRMRYDPAKEARTGTLIRMSPVSTRTGIGGGDDDDDDDGDGIGGGGWFGKGKIMLLRVGGAAESRIGVGAGLARRAAHSAALAANTFVGYPEENDARGYSSGAKGGKGGKASGAKSGGKGSSSSGRQTIEYDDDEEGDEENDDVDDDEDEDDDGDEVDARRYILVNRYGSAGVLENAAGTIGISSGGGNYNSSSSSSSSSTTTTTDAFAGAVKAASRGIQGLATMPCGTCPVRDQCTPGGLISPETCVYFSTWLEF